MAERYLHETIKNIDIEIPDLYEDEMKDMIEDPIEETAIVIDLTVNRYITTQSSAAAAAADPDPEEEPNDSTNNLYVLDGFLGDSVDEWNEELNGLVHNKTVTAKTLREIKKEIMRYRSRIKHIAWQLKTEGIHIDMTVDLTTWYDDKEEEEDVVLDVDFDEEDQMSDLDDYGVEEEAMIDIEDDNNDVKKPALRSSVDALDTRTFEKKEDLEMMLKSSSCRSCGICLDEFSIAVAGAGAAGGISIKTMPCLHIFHSGCIEPWLEKMHTCPICRYGMPTDVCN